MTQPHPGTTGKPRNTSPEDHAARVTVIGGGIAGLAAAVSLVDAGLDVTVLEADAFGGKLATMSFAGRPVEEGPDAFLARVPDAVAFARRVGLGDDLVAPATGRAFVCIDGSLVPLPGAHVLGIPADPTAPDLAPILSPATLARLQADLTDPGPPPDDGDLAIGPFIRERLGDEVADRLVGPLVGGINAGDIDMLSLAAVAPQIDRLARQADEPSLVRAAARARAAVSTSTTPLFLAPRRGMSSLVDAAVATLKAAGARLVDHANVRSIERVGMAWRVVVDEPRHSGAATETIVEADGIVLAAPAPSAAFLLQDHAPDAAQTLAEIPYASVAIATFAYRPDDIGHPLDGSGFLVPASEGMLATAASWLSSKWERLAPERGDGTFLIRVSAGRIGDTRISQLGDAALIDAVAEELARIMGIAAPPVATHLRRWPSSLAQYLPGHRGRIADVEQSLTRLDPPVGLAGSALHGVGIPASIASGTQAARAVATRLADRRPPGASQR